MSFRYIFIVSLNLRSVIYLRRFPNVEKRAQTMGLPAVNLKCDKHLMESLLTSLAINTNNTECPQNEYFVENQLPVVQMTYSGTKLWPILVIEQNGLLFCCYPLSENNSNDLIDKNSIAECFTALQTISRYFTIEKGMSWIEWFLTSMAPFGTLISQKFKTIDKFNRKTVKLENSSQNESLKILVNELISRNRDKEIIFGTISTDSTYCLPQLVQNSSVVLKLKNIESLDLVLPSNCSKNGSNVKIRPSLQLNPLHVIHYNCGSESVPIKTFLSYNYNIIQSKNQKNLYEINLSLSLKNANQFKLNHFNVHFKHITENSWLTPIKSELTFGQLRFETIGLFWIIGSKFPKSGRIGLNFSIICSNNELLGMETICNFKIENFQTSLIYADTQHLTIEDMSIETNSKVPLICESTLTSIDYKLFSENSYIR